MRPAAILILLLLLNCCNTQRRSEFTPDDRLISFDDEFVMEMDSLMELDTSFYEAIFSAHFFDRTDTILFDENEIYISYLGVVNGCADYAGDIKFNGDSLILDLINTGNYVCTSQTCNRMRFRIKNEEKKKYIIKKW